jgi:hypothetical protein
MYELIKNTITNPYWAIIVIIILWTLFYLVFLGIKLSQVNWKRLEYIWIWAGFLGVVGIIVENDKIEKQKELFYIRQNITFNMSHIEFHLSEQNACFKYNKMSWSPSDFGQRQEDQDKFCKWASYLRTNLDTLDGIPIYSLDTLSLKALDFTTSFLSSELKYLCKYFNDTRAEIERYKTYKKVVNSITWNEFNKSFGIILFVLAFALRLAIATNNVQTVKNN